MKKKILFSGIGSTFPYIMDLLEDKYDLYFIDSNEVLKKIYPDKKLFIVPLVNNESFEDSIEKIIKQNNIEYYIPGIDEEIPKTFYFQSKFKNLKLICPNKKFVDLCLDKYILMRELEQQNISKVITYKYEQLKNQIDFPFFLKPRTGRGSRGIAIINNNDQLESYFIMEKYKKDEVIIQEILEGTEYTVSVVVNNLNKLIAIVPKRIITKKGITLNAVTEKNEIIREICKEIVDKLNPCGLFNVQLKIVNNEVKIFEINPRTSTTSILTCQAGINEFELCIESYNKEDIKFIESFKENLYLFRRWETLFYE